MGHITIFLQIFSLLIGGLVCLYVYLALKTVQEPAARSLFLFLLFSTLVDLTELFVNYLGLNMEHIHGKSPFWPMPTAVFLVWSISAYLLATFVRARAGKKMTLWLTGLFAAAVLVPGIIFSFGIITFQINTADLHICEIVALRLISVLFMIGILLSSLAAERLSRREVEKSSGLLLEWLLAGYLMLFVSEILRGNSAFWASLDRLFLIGALLIWFRRRLMKKGPPAFAGGSSELAGTIGLRYGLSNREKEILALILEGKNNKEIEQALFISASTIRNHVSSLYGKIGINSRGQLMNLVLKIRKDRP